MAGLFRRLFRARSLRSSSPDGIDTEFADFLHELARDAPPQAGIGTISFGHVAGPGEPLPLYAAMAMLCARHHHPAARLLLFSEHEPQGPWWDMIGAHVAWCPVPLFADLDHGLARQPRGRMLLVRLMVLQAVGGAFVATDMVILRAMDDLAHHPMVLGAQGSAPVTRFAFGEGLALARPGNDFCRVWLEACLAGAEQPVYDLACRLPVRLYAGAPGMAHILPHTAWFSPVQQRIRSFLFQDDPDEALRLCAHSLALPLWSDLLKEALEAWTPQAMAENDCLFSRLWTLVLPVVGEGAQGHGVSVSRTVA